ncbi:MAG: transcriptional regulator PpsR [Pararhodobacter sp.]
MTNDGRTFSSTGSRPLFGSSLLSGVMASVADIALLVEPSGLVRAAMAGSDSRNLSEIADWPGKTLEALTDAESAAKIARRITEILNFKDEGAEDAVLWAELIHEQAGAEGFPVRYSLHWLPEEQAILMLGRDQRPVIEMQQQLLNAQIALERDYEAQREMDTRYRLLMDFTTDSIVIVAMNNGRIVDLNHHAAALLGAARADLLGVDFMRQFVADDGDDMLAAIAAMQRTGGEPRNAETLRDSLPLRVHGRLFRAAGERLVLCRLERADHTGAAAGPLANDLDQLFYKGVDAIVFTDKDGLIVAASDAFLNITDSVGIDAVRGRSLGDFLARGAIDLKVLLENARRAGHLRSYATKLVTDFDAHVAVELSATWLGDRSDPRLALIIRDTSSSLSMRGDLSLGEDNVRGVMELVGSSTLKDIVAETTNVVERICIETAIELTRNNRVAAAEMLGLSRQSLYVKLRKYGLLSREEE